MNAADSLACNLIYKLLLICILISIHYSTVIEGEDIDTYIDLGLVFVRQE